MKLLLLFLLSSMTVPDSGRYVFFANDEKIGFEEFHSEDGRLVSHLELKMGGFGQIVVDIEFRSKRGILDTYILNAKTPRGTQYLKVERIGKRAIARFSTGTVTETETLALPNIYVKVVDNNVISTLNSFVQRFTADSEVVIVPQALKLVTIKRIEDGLGELICDGKSRVVRKLTISIDNRVREELYFVGDTLAFVYQPLGKIQISLNERFRLPKRKPNYKRKKLSVKSGDVKIKGEVDLPKKTKPKAMVMLIAGSGRVDRHELGVFDDLADCLTASGYAVARYDKRGVGKSGGKYEDLSLNDLIEDAVSVAEFLKKKYKGLPLIIFGHSEGGMFSFIVAKRSDANGVIAMAAPCKRLTELLVEQLVRKGLIDSSEADSVGELIDSLVDSLARSENVKGMVKLPIGGALPAKWLKEHALLDPDTLVDGWNGRTLLIAGSEDLHVPPNDVVRFKELLEKNGADVQFLVLEGQTHFFEDRDSLCSTVIEWLEELKVGERSGTEAKDH